MIIEHNFEFEVDMPDNETVAYLMEQAIKDEINVLIRKVAKEEVQRRQDEFAATIRKAVRESELMVNVENDHGIPNNGV